MKRFVILILLLHSFLLGVNQIQHPYTYKPILNYNSGIGEFTISSLPHLHPIKGNTETLPYFKFLIITGDGDYRILNTKGKFLGISQSLSFPYLYGGFGDYDVKIFSKPQKSHTKVPIFQQTIRAKGGGDKLNSPFIFGEKWVTIISPFGNEFVPKDTLPFPIHVKTLGAENREGGFLIIGCNGKKGPK